MQFAPKQAVLTLNEAQKKKVENMGRFITTMYINDLTFVNFSDGNPVKWDRIWARVHVC